MSGCTGLKGDQGRLLIGQKLLEPGPCDFLALQAPFTGGIWTPPVEQVSFSQNEDAYVYSAFLWRRYLLTLNVCALYFLYEYLAWMAS